jgi:hypothetical protein
MEKIAKNPFQINFDQGYSLHGSYDYSVLRDGKVQLNLKGKLKSKKLKETNSAQLSFIIGSEKVAKSEKVVINFTESKT